MKYLSLFSGIGAFEKALDNLKIKYQLVGYSEIDKYASKSYSEIHDISEEMNLGDITQINEFNLGEVDLITYGFPCQDISLAGKQKGFTDEDGNKTRSGLFFDALRIIKATQPKIAIAENVKSLTSKKFKDEFELVLSSLKKVGYNNYWKILNAKDYGVPQNRERVFIISIRKDIDNGEFKFPVGIELDKCMKDFLDDEVDVRYYLKKEIIKNINLDECNKTNKTEVINPLKNKTIYGWHFEQNIYNPHGLIRSIKAGGGSGNIPKIITNNLKIRKLTPKECFRLMGFTDKDFEKCTCSNTQLYKQAGNSIVVNVLERLFENIFRVVEI